MVKSPYLDKRAYSQSKQKIGSGKNRTAEEKKVPENGGYLRPKVLDF